MLRAKPQDGRLIGIGIGTPGFTDVKSGIFLEGCQYSFPSGQFCSGIYCSQFGVPTVAVNAICAALGELLFGAGRECSNFVMITIGTDIGGSLVLDGKLFRGAKGYAAEIGHRCVDPNGPWCICGSRGCLEQRPPPPGQPIHVFG